jgi:hypothetical protein
MSELRFQVSRVPRWSRPVAGNLLEAAVGLVLKGKPFQPLQWRHRDRMDAFSFDPLLPWFAFPQPESP